MEGACYSSAAQKGAPGSLGLLGRTRQCRYNKGLVAMEGRASVGFGGSPHSLLETSPTQEEHRSRALIRPTGDGIVEPLSWEEGCPGAHPPGPPPYLIPRRAPATLIVVP